jgi:protein gp37
MAEHSPIGWTDNTWPIIGGCDYVSPGCSNCWAVRDSWRLAHNPHAAVRAAFADTVRKTDDGKLVWTGLVRTLPQRLDWPLRWRAARLIFVCSQADLFNPKVPFEFIAAAFGVMAAAPLHTFQVLTKHPARMREFFDWLAADREGPVVRSLWEARRLVAGFGRHEPFPNQLPAWPLENVWAGVTVEDQKRADERIPELLNCPAVVRWLSVEPMLESVSIRPWLTSSDGVDWVVCGGESAQTRATTREFRIGWALSLLEQCRAANVRFFMKQLGTKPQEVAFPTVASDEERRRWHAAGWSVIHDLNGEHWRRYPKIPAGRTSRYKWHEPEFWPLELRVQEFPT